MLLLPLELKFVRSKVWTGSKLFCLVILSQWMDKARNRILKTEADFRSRISDHEERRLL